MAGDSMARIHGDIARALAEIAAGDADEQAIRRLHPRARYRDPHPVFQLTASLVRWAVESAASEVHLIPGEDGVRARFTRNGVTETVMTLPKPLQEPITARLKDGAAMDVIEQDAPKDGVTPVVSDGALYDMTVSALPTEEGEKILLRLVRKADQNAAPA